MNLLSNLKMKFIALAIVFCSALAVHAQTPVAKYGQLKIFNGKVSDQAGNPVVLRGVSLFWSGYPEGSPYYNSTTVKWLRDDWCVDVVRASMSVETGSSNYINNPSTELAKVKAVIDACIANGLYVIVDFHTHNAENYKTQAKAFFTEIATSYGNTANVLYETFNEPINQSWSGTIKPYHNELIQTIRAKDADNIIICGTRTYSQDVDEAANDQVTGTNIAYTLHYYANSHQGSLRQKASNALNKGVALFVTEYGTTDASGNGGYNPNESQTWWNYLEANKLSSANWSIGNKNETSAALKPGVGISGWSANDLTASGALVKGYIKGKCGVIVTTGSVTLSFAGGKTQYNAGESVVMTAATSVANGTIAKVEFYNGATVLGSDNSSPYTFTTTTLSSGGHNITAKSFDAGGNLIAESPLYVISIVGASNVATTGITDQFEEATQFSELTGGGNGTNCAAPNEAAAAGIFWFEDRNATTPFKAEATRAGDGKLQYLVSQEKNAYNVIGFNFGVYCEAGAQKKYTLDLTQNAILSLTVSAPATNTATLDLKFQMKDADGTVIAINKNVLLPNGTVDGPNWYKYEIGFSKNHLTPDFLSLAPNTSTNFVFDFKNALSIKNPNAPTFPADINTNNADFDFSKVVEVVIVPVNKLDTGSPTYQPLAFTDQKIIFSGLTLGNPALGTDICTTPAAVKTATKTYCQGATNAVALTATSVPGLTLKWYSTLTGGTANETAPIPSTSVAGDKSYYVSQATSSTSTCEGPRTELKVTIAPAATADAGDDLEITTATSVSLGATGSATGIWKLQNGPTGATVAFSPSATAATTTATGLTAEGTYRFVYSVAGTGTCAGATDTIEVVKSPPPCTTPKAVTPVNASYCKDATGATALTATGMDTGMKLQWYTVATGGVAADAAPVPSTATVGVKNYYVSQVSTTNPTCEGPRALLKVTTVAPATASAGTDKSIGAETTATLTGTGSATGTWSVTGKPNAASITFSPSANSATVTVNGLTVDGPYTFVYTVNGTQPCGAKTDDITINKVTPVCTNPTTAAAGTDQQITTTGITTATLTGTGSAAGTWSVKGKPGSSTITFSPSASSATVTANGLTVDGQYTFTYTVAGTAPCAASVSDDVEVTKTSPSCTNPPTATATTTDDITSSTSATLTGTGSGNGTWTIGDKPAGTTVSFSPSATSATVTVNGLTADGDYTFTYTVNGVSPCQPAASSVTVTKATPTCANPTKSNAGANQTISTETTTILTGTGSATGTWSLQSGPAAVTFSPSATGTTVTASGLTEVGTYTFKYLVTGVAPCDLEAASTLTVTKSTTTAVNEAYLMANIEMYPNPVADMLLVDMDKVNGTKSLKVVDMLGRVVYETQAVSIVNIDMSDMSKGMYFVHIETASGKITKSVIKQ